MPFAGNTVIDPFSPEFTTDAPPSEVGRLGRWLRGLLFTSTCAVILSIPVLIPTSDGDFNTSLWSELSGSEYDKELWHKGFAPLWVLGIMVFTLCSVLKESIGDMLLKEVAPGCDIGAAAKGSLENQALVAALFLTIIFPMAQVDPPSDSNELVNLWYFGLVWLGVAFVLASLMVATMTLVNLQGLDQRSGAFFVNRHRRELGEPVSTLVSSLLMSMFAAILWATCKYGLVAFFTGTSVFMAIFSRLWATAEKLAGWKNPEVQANDREARKLKDPSKVVVAPKFI